MELPNATHMTDIASQYEDHADTQIIYLTNVHYKPLEM